jgi:hypothetical protein
VAEKSLSRKRGQAETSPGHMAIWGRLSFCAEANPDAKPRGEFGFLLPAVGAEAFGTPVTAQGERAPWSRNET